MEPDAVDIDELLRDRAAALGFAAWGVADAAPIARPDALRAWLEAGKQGEMSWLAEHESILRDPAELVAGARSIICVVDRYADGRRDVLGRPHWGRIARYARGADYHRVLRGRLEILRDELRVRFRDHRFRACVDTAPLMEREHAARAGVGAIGKNTLLISPGLGSWILLGAIVTTLPLRARAASGRDPCGECTRCIDACPTDAITPWSVDATRCIAYLTIEHSGTIEPAVAPKVGDWLFGCDICQEVCPHNQPTRRSRRLGVSAEYAPRRDGFDAVTVLDWDQDAWRNAVDGTALNRARLAAMKRNAILVATNTVPPESRATLSERLKAIAGNADESEPVRHAAHAAIARLHGLE